MPTSGVLASGYPAESQYLYERFELIEQDQIPNQNNKTKTNKKQEKETCWYSSLVEGCYSTKILGIVLILMGVPAALQIWVLDQFKATWFILVCLGGLLWHLSVMVDNCVWLSQPLILILLEHNAHCLIFRGNRAGIEGLWRALGVDTLTSLTAELGQ